MKKKKEIVYAEKIIPSNVIEKMLKEIEGKRRYSGKVDKNGSPKDSFDPSTFDIEIPAPKQKNWLNAYVKKLKQEGRLDEKVLQKLEECFEVLSDKWHEAEAEDIEKLRKEVVKDYRKLIKAMAKVISIGLSDHRIENWIQTFHATGNREALRMLKKGFEKDAVRPLKNEKKNRKTGTIKESELHTLVCDLHEKGHSWRNIHRIAKKNNLYSATWQAFMDWVETHDLT